MARLISESCISMIVYRLPPTLRKLHSHSRFSSEMGANGPSNFEGQETVLWPRDRDAYLLRLHQPASSLTIGTCDLRRHSSRLSQAPS
uniref:Uncharacterized protein n=1 Tax=Agrobacterium tumefaciens TaxID=358 RepID=K7X7E6_AGRTU|nr:Hypothetical protein [Agrobacterium radiobacter]